VTKKNEAVCDWHHMVGWLNGIKIFVVKKLFNFIKISNQN